MRNHRTKDPIRLSLDPARTLRDHVFRDSVMTLQRLSQYTVCRIDGLHEKGEKLDPRHMNERLDKRLERQDADLYVWAQMSFQHFSWDPVAKEYLTTACRTLVLAVYCYPEPNLPWGNPKKYHRGYSEVGAPPR